MIAAAGARSVLIVAAHPDDEILGCGATIARHVEAGDRVSIFIVAEGATSRATDPSDQTGRAEVERLKDAARKAGKAVGVDEVRFGGFPDNRMDGVVLLDVVKAVENVVADLRPRIVYTHHGGDLNVDHKYVHDAVMTACRPLPGSSIEAIYSFEVLSSTGWGGASREKAFVPTRFVDVSATLDRKMNALTAYEAEMRAFPHARSMEAVRALAQVRGAEAGIAAAEAFQVEREILY